jgi:hypothetical protein
LSLGFSFLSDVTASTAAPTVYTPALATVAAVVTARSATAITAHPESAPQIMSKVIRFIVIPQRCLIQFDP